MPFTRGKTQDKDTGDQKEVSQVLKEKNHQPRILFLQELRGNQDTLRENEEIYCPQKNRQREFSKQTRSVEKRNLGTSERKNRKNENKGKYNRLSFSSRVV